MLYYIPPFDIGILGHSCFHAALSSVASVYWQATEKACLPFFQLLYVDMGYRLPH